jgi:hypothetical protein
MHPTESKAPADATGVHMQAVTLTALLLLAYATGVTSYALIAAWILRPERASK